MAAPDHTCCHFYGFQSRIRTVAAKLPIIETFNKQAKKCNAFVWFGTAVEHFKSSFFGHQRMIYLRRAQTSQIENMSPLLEGPGRLVAFP